MKKDLLDFLKKISKQYTDIKCITIEYLYNKLQVNLIVEFSYLGYIDFLSKLDKLEHYQINEGSIIWFKDGSFAEIDGKDYLAWYHRTVPKIPDYLYSVEEIPSLNKKLGI